MPSERESTRLRARAVLELLLTLGFAVAMAWTAQAYVVKPYKIPTGSMEPTLAVGERVLVNRLAVELGQPHVGEIVVFHPPAGAEQQDCGEYGAEVRPGGAACSTPGGHEASVNFIKRVVAGPGDEIYISQGHVYRRARGTTAFLREQDTYIAACGSSSECNFPTPITIPNGTWFMMGDNRGDSDDSRFWGPVPTSWIIGVAFTAYWPLGRLGPP
jgi:signal peptidase I